MNYEQLALQETVRAAFPGATVHVTPSSRHRAHRYVDVTVIVPSETPAQGRHCTVTIGDARGALAWDATTEEVIAALKAGDWKSY